jgi:DnaK suppressor protein
MNAKKIEDTRRRLSGEYQNLIRLINRSRLAEEEIKVENTEDEGDLATISHDRGLLYNLHEGGFARLRFIQEAIKAIDRGQYGECIRCRGRIDEKRLEAVPWAMKCLGCQEETESTHAPSRMMLAGWEAKESEDVAHPATTKNKNGGRSKGKSTTC